MNIMSFTFKQFSAFIDEATEDKTPEQLDEIFGRLFGKKPEEKNDNRDPMTDRRKLNLLKQRDALLKQKGYEEEKRRALRKAADEKWAKAKNGIEGKISQTVAPAQKIGRKDDYPFHRLNLESKSLKRPGFFTMTDTIKIQTLDLDGAKKYLLGKIENAKDAKPSNITKAANMVNKATSVKKLMFDVSNFILAHETDSLKVIK